MPTERRRTSEPTTNRRFGQGAMSTMVQGWGRVFGVARAGESPGGANGAACRAHLEFLRIGEAGLVIAGRYWYVAAVVS
jgi:hypothetical protein